MTLDKRTLALALAAAALAWWWRERNRIYVPGQGYVRVQNDEVEAAYFRGYHDALAGEGPSP